MKKTNYDIATRNGRETVSGYTVGDFGARKGTFFYEFTHIPTGLLIAHPGIAGVKSAKQAVEAMTRMVAGDECALPTDIKDLLSRCGGFGRFPLARRRGKHGRNGASGRSRPDMSERRHKPR